MRIGYACVNTQLPSSARTVRLANATPERLLELAEANLDALETILRWNDEHGIQVFRVTSNLIPLASHPVNTVAWWDELAYPEPGEGRVHLVMEGVEDDRGAHVSRRC